MFESILNNISSLTPFWIYVTLFVFSFVENVFPPSPSDLVIVIGGTLVATGVIHFIPTLLLSTVGSVLGFMVLFYFGSTVDKRLVHSGKYKYIPIDAIEKVEQWFKKYGYWIILVNRFLPGTRSVISFFAGMSRLDVKRTVLLSTISSILWNAIILYLGFLFGHNVGVVDKYLSTYSNIAIGVTAIIVLIFVIRYFIKKKKTQSENL